MEIEINVSQKEWTLFSKHFQKKLRKNTKAFPNTFWEGFLLWLPLTLVSTLAFHLINLHWQTALFVIGVVIVIASVCAVNYLRLRNGVKPSEDGSFIGKHHFVFDSEGIRSEGRGYKSFRSWTIVKSIERKYGVIMIFIDTITAYVIPEGDLDDPETFFKTIVGFYEQNKRQA